MQKYFDAVESFHKALSLRRDDAFSTTMLNNVVEHLVDDITPFEAYPSEVPKLPPVPMNMSSGVSTFFLHSNRDFSLASFDKSSLETQSGLQITHIYIEIGVCCFQ